MSRAALRKDPVKPTAAPAPRPAISLAAQRSRLLRADDPPGVSLAVCPESLA